jgi:hypothetical protein
MQLKPSLIMMDAINVIIVRNRSAHEMSHSNTTRKAVAISLKATRQPCRQMQQEHRESIVSITTILIPQQQLLSQEHQLLQCKRDKRKKEILYTGKLRQIRQVHAPDLPRRTWDQQQTYKNRTCKPKKKSIVTRAVLGLQANLEETSVVR